jgi:hypothetical protein
VTQTFSDLGNSITVTLANGALTLDSVAAAPGYTYELQQVRADRVRVEFFGATDGVRIEVNVVDGQMVATYQPNNGSGGGGSSGPGG